MKKLKYGIKMQTKTDSYLASKFNLDYYEK